MATGSANTPHTFGKKIKHQSQDIKNLYSLVTVGKGIERISSGISSIVNTGSALSTLKTAGDTMIGAIAYNPKVATVDLSGEIDVGDTTDAYTSYIMLTGSTNPDDLVTISNPTHAGQILIIETVPELVLKHNTGNIFIPDEADRTIIAGGICTLIWDTAVHSAKWVLLSGGGGGGWSGNATSDLDMNTYDIIDVDRLQFTKDSGAGRTNSKVEMYASGHTPEDAIINHPEDSYFRFTENGQQYLTISNNSQDGIIPVSSGSMNLGSGTKQWASVNTEQITVHGGGSGINGTQIGLNMATSGGQVGVHCGGSANNGAWTSIWDGLEDLGRSGNYWKDLYIHEIQIKDTSANPTTNGQFTRNGNDVKVYTGGGVKNLSDIGSGGGGGFPNPADDDLDMNDYDILDLDVLNLKKGGSTINSANAGMSATSSGITINTPPNDFIDFNEGGTKIVRFDADGIDLDGTGNHINFDDVEIAVSASSGFVSLPSNPVAFIKVKVGGNLKLIPYYSTT